MPFNSLCTTNWSIVCSSDEVIILSAAGTAAKINLVQESSGGPAGGAGATSASSTSPVSGPINTVGGGSQAQPVERVTSGVGSGGGAGGAGVLKENKDKHLFVDIGLANQALQRSMVSVDG